MVRFTCKYECLHCFFLGRTDLTRIAYICISSVTRKFSI